MVPPTMSLPLGRSRTMEWHVVVLPQPDSPTRPSVSPSLRVKLTPSTALTTRVPRKLKKCVCKSETCINGVVIAFHRLARFQKLIVGNHHSWIQMHIDHLDSSVSIY